MFCADALQAEGPTAIHSRLKAIEDAVKVVGLLRCHHANREHAECARNGRDYSSGAMNCYELLYAASAEDSN